LREFVKGIFPLLETGSAVKKALQKNQIKLNQELGHSGDWVSAGCVITYEYTYHFDQKRLADVEIFYEDDHLMVVRKPPGLSSNGNSRSLQQRLQAVEITDAEGALPFPYLVHRLDKATEGLMIAAKHIETRRLLAIMMENHSIHKLYVLIAEGHISNALEWIEEDLDGKPARTEILKTVLLNTKDPTSKVFVRIHSGRTHQIRKHFSLVGHPLVGDTLYNKDGLNFGTGLLLCAYHLEFEHPKTYQRLISEYQIPSKIEKYPSL
jgi:23S rRNA-/tRNA-specific pseudouridylate synthase